MTFRIYKGVEIVAEGDSPLEITGLPQDTEYPAGTFEATRLENGRESERVDVPYFRTLYFADYEENDVELALTVDSEETTGTYTILGMPADKYVGGEHDENIVYAVQPDEAESGAVYFLGDQYVDRVVRDGEVVYGRNLVLNSVGPNRLTWANIYIIPKNRLSNVFSKAGNYSTQVKFMVTENAEKQVVDNIDIRSLNFSYYDKTRNNFNYFLPKIDQTEAFNAQKGDVFNRSGTVFMDEDRIKNSDRFAGYCIRENGTPGINQTIEYERLKIEYSSKPTPYTVAPEDLFPSTSTFPSFPEWPEEDTEERI